MIGQKRRRQLVAADKMSTHPVEADTNEGLPKGCPLNLLGPVVPLTLRAGSAQLLSYTTAGAGAQGYARDVRGQIGRRQPRLRQ